MSGPQQVIIDISPAGSVTIDAKCFQGSNCAAATEVIEQTLGGSGRKTKKKKPEFFAPAGLKQTNKLTF